MKSPYLYIAYIFLIFAIFLPRVLDLDTFFSPDEPQWEKNTQNFVAAVRMGDFKAFYQQPHPGITTQWIGAATIEAPTWGEKRLPLAVFLGFAVLYATYLVRRLWGDLPSLIAGFLLALNPLLVAHSRILAMDALLGIFMLIAILHHFLWLDKKEKKDALLAGACTALAILSKMSGVGILAYFFIATLIALGSKKISLQDFKQGIVAYIIGLLVTTVVVFPTVITNFQYVLEGSKQFFTTEHFQQQVHALGPWWYPQAFLLWTTPLQLLGIFLLPIALLQERKYRLPLLLCAIFCIVFFLEIQYSVKKGDRYMLPIFIAFDILSAGSFVAIYGAIKERYAKLGLVGMALLIVVGIGFQAQEVMRLHPYLLAYRNPFFTSLAQGRTMGWGEGLDLAAEYLNKKPGAEEMLVAAYYESSFAYHFKGKFTSAERLAKETPEEIGAQYVVLYRTMEGRAPERWETKVLKEYATKTPEHVIKLNNEEYVWIYKAL